VFMFLRLATVLQLDIHSSLCRPMPQVIKLPG
jgi:hypothetical protein